MFGAASSRCGGITAADSHQTNTKLGRKSQFNDRRDPSFCLSGYRIERWSHSAAAPNVAPRLVISRVLGLAARNDIAAPLCRFPALNAPETVREKRLTPWQYENLDDQLMIAIRILGAGEHLSDTARSATPVSWRWMLPRNCDYHLTAAAFNCC